MRVMAVTPGRLERAPDGNGPPRMPAAGETLRLALDEVAGDDLLARTDDGLVLRLAGLARQSRAFTPGDVLMLRVVATAPQLELELFGTIGARPGPSAGNDATTPAALRFDQAALSQIAWKMPEPAALAARWRQQVLAGNAAPLPQTLAPAALLAQQAAPESAHQLAERWAFPVYAWGGVPALLDVVAAEDDDKAPRRRRPAHALRLEMVLPGLGRVSMRLQGDAAGIQLQVAVERAQALPPVRDALPAVAAAMARAGLRLLRVAISQGRVPQGGPGAAAAGDAAALSPALFRAAAEVAVALLSSAVAGRVSPANR